jgi:hypothetical protein
MTVFLDYEGNKYLAVGGGRSFLDIMVRLTRRAQVLFAMFQKSWDQCTYLADRHRSFNCPRIYGSYSRVSRFKLWHCTRARTCALKPLMTDSIMARLQENDPTPSVNGISLSTTSAPVLNHLQRYI